MSPANDAFLALTEKQRDCLRLAASHLSTKEIARELGISASAVEQRLKYAVRAVGARDRREAARLFVRWETTYGETIYGLSDVVRDKLTEHHTPTGAQVSDTWEAPHVSDSIGYFDPQWDQPVSKTFVLPLPGRGRSPSALGKAQRALWIGGLTVGFLLVFGIFVAGLEALSRLHG